MDKAKILVVDDEESMCKFMEVMLKKEGYQVSISQDAPTALERVKCENYDLVIADLMMPEMSGLELLSQVKSVNPDIDLIVMTAFASVDSAIEALKKGAFDYITKPFKVDEIKIAVRKSLEQKKISQENIQLKKELQTKFDFDSFIGNSLEITKLKKMAQRIARSDSTVLLEGESGTGKELIARAIHYHSHKSHKPFVTINCAALPENLLESELFGHVKGSFTGAIKDKEGLFKVADGGTFFLDEVGMTSAAIQAKLLRAIEEKEITPVGGTAPIKVDVRLIAATNVNLEQEVKSGNFRADLFYRLHVIPIRIPPLRQRKDDIKLLSSYFVRKYSQKMQMGEKNITDEAMKRLISYKWPGNVRELENAIEHAVLLSRGNQITPEDFPQKIKEGREIDLITEAQPTAPTLETIEKAYIFWVLNQTGWQKSKAASILGIDSSTLYRKIEKYKLKSPASSVGDL
ncbi:MAG: sigma-54-dependent Fis family transcriptional regulator [candidate division Zixibacteria bacterium]|nr:sigma-54-dependent Fis family transcriptional regulator [candidate division Zixibacteria bacterium]